METKNKDQEAMLSIGYGELDSNQYSDYHQQSLVETFWEETRDIDGNVSYLNMDTGEIRYELPGVNPLKVEEENSVDGSVVSVTSFINALSGKITKKTIDRSMKRVTRKEERKMFESSRLKQAQLKNALITDKLLSAYPNSAPPVGHPDYADFMKRKEAAEKAEAEIVKSINKPIDRMDVQCNVLQTFDSGSMVCEEFGIEPIKLYKHLQGKIASLFGFYFRFRGASLAVTDSDLVELEEQLEETTLQGDGDEDSLSVYEIPNSNKLLLPSKLSLNFEEIGDVKLKELAEQLIHNSVETLCLTKNSITNIGVKYLSESLAKNRSLTELHLNDNLIGDVGVEALCLSLGESSLRLLNLSVNKITKVGAKHIALLLSRPSSQLRSLFLGGRAADKSSFAGGGGSASTNGDDYAASPTPTAPTARTAASVKSMSHASKSATSSAVKQNPTIPRIGSDGVTLIAAALMQPTCRLEKIWLQNQSITQSGIRALCAVIYFNKTLTEINLSDNFIKDINPLKEALFRNQTISSMICHNCGLDIRKLGIIANSVKHKSNAPTWQETCEVNQIASVLRDEVMALCEKNEIKFPSIMEQAPRFHARRRVKESLIEPIWKTHEDAEWDEEDIVLLLRGPLPIGESFLFLNQLSVKLHKALEKLNEKVNHQRKLMDKYSQELKDYKDQLVQNGEERKQKASHWNKRIIKLSLTTHHAKLRLDYARQKLHKAVHSKVHYEDSLHEISKLVDHFDSISSTLDMKMNRSKNAGSMIQNLSRDNLGGSVEGDSSIDEMTGPEESEPQHEEGVSLMMGSVGGGMLSSLGSVTGSARESLREEEEEEEESVSVGATGDFEHSRLAIKGREATTQHRIDELKNVLIPELEATFNSRLEEHTKADSALQNDVKMAHEELTAFDEEGSKLESLKTTCLKYLEVAIKREAGLTDLRNQLSQWLQHFVAWLTQTSSAEVWKQSVPKSSGDLLIDENLRVFIRKYEVRVLRLQETCQELEKIDPTFLSLHPEITQSLTLQKTDTTTVVVDNSSPLNMFTSSKTPSSTATSAAPLLNNIDEKSESLGNIEEEEEEEGEGEEVGNNTISSKQRPLLADSVENRERVGMGMEDMTGQQLLLKQAKQQADRMKREYELNCTNPMPNSLRVLHGQNTDKYQDQILHHPSMDYMMLFQKEEVESETKQEGALSRSLTKSREEEQAIEYASDAAAVGRSLESSPSSTFLQKKDGEEVYHSKHVDIEHLANMLPNKSARKQSDIKLARWFDEAVAELSMLTDEDVVELMKAKGLKCTDLKGRDASIDDMICALADQKVSNMKKRLDFFT